MALIPSNARRVRWGGGVTEQDGLRASCFGRGRDVGLGIRSIRKRA